MQKGPMKKLTNIDHRKIFHIKTLGIVGISLHRCNQLSKNNSVTNSISKTSEKLHTALNIVTAK